VVSTDSAGWRSADDAGTLSTTRSLLGGLAAVAAIGVIAVLILGGRDGPHMTPAVAEHPVAIPAAARTVLVSRSMPMPSAHERRLSAMLETGAMPHVPTMAEVMTDTECAPDERMISRCRNVVRLPDGRRAVLRHPHDMAKIPCLAPGERVRLIPSGV
jgi:hypothetical protein